MNQIPTQVVMEPENEETTETRKEVRMHSTIGVGINTIMYTCIYYKSLAPGLVCKSTLSIFSLPVSIYM